MDKKPATSRRKPLKVEKPLMLNQFSVVDEGIVRIEA
jgi:hypothetical protein